MSYGFLKEASTCRIEASFDVAFDEPLGACPGLADLVQGRVASPVRSEAVAMGGELWFIIRFEDGAYDVLHHFIRPYGHVEWPFAAVGLVLEDAPGRGPAPLFLTD